MLEAIERFLTSNASPQKRNRLVFEMLPLFGTRFGKNNSEQDSLEKLYYKFPFSKDEKAEFSNLDYLPIYENDDNHKLEDLTEKDIKNIKNKYIIMPFFEALEAHKRLSAKDKFRVKKALERLGVPKTGVRNDDRKLLNELIENYYRY